MQTQLRSAISHRQKPENRQKSLLLEELDLRDLWKAKQQEITEATNELTIAIAQVGELEQLHRAEGMAAIHRAAPEYAQLVSSAAGVCYVAPAHFQLFQQWCSSQLGAIAANGSGTANDGNAYDGSQLFQAADAASTVPHTQPVPITPTGGLRAPEGVGRHASPNTGEGRPAKLARVDPFWTP